MPPNQVLNVNYLHRPAPAADAEAPNNHLLKLRLPQTAMILPASTLIDSGLSRSSHLLVDRQLAPWLLPPALEVGLHHHQASTVGTVVVVKNA